MKQNNAIVPGSIQSLCQQTGASIAESFLNADAIVMVDTSGSMEAHDSVDGKSRYEVACRELAEIQKDNPGKIAVVSFSDYATFNPGGVPNQPNGMTAMDKALNFVKIADGTNIKLILISDGMPNSEESTLRVAKTFKSKIHTIYIGSETDQLGRKFLEKLAMLTGGESSKSVKPGMLGDPMKTLLLKG